MIIDFKIFENNNNRKKSWLVSTKQPHLKISLRKIGMDEENIKLINKVFENAKKLNPTWIYTYIIYSSDTNKWGWRNYKGGTKYMGQIKITKEEMEEQRLRDKAEKYNL